MQWRLFREGTNPAYTRKEFFTGHVWINPATQRGHAARTDMVADMVIEALLGPHDVTSVTDLGCGDGALIQKIERRAAVERLDVDVWGYDLGVQNIHVATTLRMVDGRIGDILDGKTPDGADLDYGDLVVATEVVEHLVDPHGFIKALPARLAILSSPFDENDTSFYEHHAWAWDTDGYRALAESCGWTVLEQRTCPEGFQAILVERAVADVAAGPIPSSARTYLVGESGPELVEFDGDGTVVGA